MKLSHIITVAILCASAVSSIAGVGLVARQFTIERTAVQVVVNTAVVERMQGVSDAVGYLSAADQQALLQKYGFSDRDAFDKALRDRRRELGEAQQVRADTLRANDKRLAGLLAACAFAGIAALMGAIATYDIAATRKQRVADVTP
ncbi:hypothetical protein [Caballeronia sp. LZ032]|uniref:hypothetical protein n=1 Tax=Caballeronia sp. LZ032 TaxID=3038565 RepID=UPI00285F6223|nr:hypothetical protein [Caballeronia sp. LZ032]MDR5883732.1 hypothetical protein [Caballeronia sp. LZ032]